MSLLQNVRFYVLLVSLGLSLVIYWWVTTTIAEPSLQIIRLTQLYALTALAYLYITLLIGPATYTFKWLPYRGYMYRARRAIGVSTFYFALIHAYFGFFGELGGFAGLPFLSNRYLLAITLSFTALIILGLMASTSFDAAIRKLTIHRWKFLHRFVYLVGVLVLIHATLVGSHFSSFSLPIPQIVFVGLILLGYLESRRFDAYLQKKFPALAPVYITQVFFWEIVGLVTIYLLTSPPLPS
jgi:DMSO/TMAO reductase YedYZ heme-binding membrane subunit